MADLQVAELWRYPVKSLRGEQLATAALTADGLHGDRLVHVREPNGRVVTSRYRPGLLGLEGSLREDGVPLIDGLQWDDPRALARVQAASASDVFLLAFAGVDDGQRYDVLPLTVLSDGMASEMGVDHRRFRPNIYVRGVDGRTEREWAGRALRIGSALIGVWRPRPRCVMTTFHPITLAQDPTILRRIVREFDGAIALDCWVIEPGEISAGARVTVTEIPEGIEVPRRSNA